MGVSFLKIHWAAYVHNLLTLQEANTDEPHHLDNKETASCQAVFPNTTSTQISSPEEAFGLGVRIHRIQGVLSQYVVVCTLMDAQGQHRRREIIPLLAVEKNVSVSLVTGWGEHGDRTSSCSSQLSANCRSALLERKYIPWKDNTSLKWNDSQLGVLK